MQSYNKTIVIGRVGSEPKLEPHSKAEFQTQFTISSSTVKDGQEEVIWHRIGAFGKQAKLCADYLHKGDLIVIEGRLDQRKYDDDTFDNTIIAEKITFLSMAKKKETENVQCAE